MNCKHLVLDRREVLINASTWANKIKTFLWCLNCGDYVIYRTEKMCGDGKMMLMKNEKEKDDFEDNEED